MILKNVEELVKGKPLVTILSEDTIEKACKIMTRENTRALAVLSGGKLIGVLSEKDIVQKCVAEGLEASITEVNMVMTTHVKTIEANQTVAHAIDIMIEGNFHHLPILQNNELVGMIYSDDIPSEYRLLHDHFKELRS
jgi:CBS domain-containing protein